MAPKLRSDKGAAKAGKKTPNKTPEVTKDDGSKINFTRRPNRLPEPNDEAAEPVDPLDKEVWEKVKPNNDDEMQTWMNDMRALILAYLRYWRAKVEDVTIQQSKARLEEAMKSEWKNWEPLADIQTGEIYDSKKREQMYRAMTAKYSTSKGNYDGQAATAAAIQYANYASAIWEDFLHYQNEWTRVPDRVTPKHSNAAPDPPQATEKDKGFMVHQDDPTLEPWQSNLIGLYEKHRIGDRTRIPDNGIGPDQLHRMPDNIRHSANGQERRNHLIEKFPTSSLRLDNDAIARRREEVDEERKAKQDAEATSIDSKKYAAVETLPEGHQPYYATNERMNPWKYKDRRIHTSWENAAWGPAVASKEHKPGKQTECNKTRWQMTSVPRLVFETKRDLDGNPKESNVEKIIWEKVFALDEGENRILDSATFWNYETPTYEPKGTVTKQHDYVTNPRSGSRHLPRREAYQKLQQSLEDNDDEMSELGDDEYQEDEVPILSSSGEEDDSEDDEETDLFLLSYRNLLGPGSGNTNGNDGGSNDGDGGSNHSHGGSSDDDGDSDDKDDDIGRLVGPMTEEDCRIGTGVEEGQRIFEYSFRYDATTTYTQRIVLDPVNNEAKDEKNDGGKISQIIYPEKGLREIFNHRDISNNAWSSVPEKGHWELKGKGKHWVPILVLIRAKKNTGKVDRVFDLTPYLTELLKTNFSKKSVGNWNKTVRQKDDRADPKSPKKSRWVKEEIEELVRILNGMALKEGIHHLVGRWSEIHREVTKAFDIFWNQRGLPKRGDETVRPKLNRSPGINKKLAEVQKAIANGSPETHPSNFFAVSDFSAAKARKPGKTETSKETTGKSVEGDETESEAGSEDGAGPKD